VCGAFLIGRNDEVLGCCARCQIVTQTPVAAVSTPGAAATGQHLGTGPSLPQEAGHAGTPAASRVSGTQLQDEDA
jgi:hypothetical protein